VDIGKTDGEPPRRLPRKGDRFNLEPGHQHVYEVINVCDNGNVIAVRITGKHPWHRNPKITLHPETMEGVVYLTTPQDIDRAEACEAFRNLLDYGESIRLNNLADKVTRVYDVKNGDPRTKYYYQVLRDAPENLCYRRKSTR